jgi:hypothetical protein
MVSHFTYKATVTFTLLHFHPFKTDPLANTTYIANVKNASSFATPAFT